MEFTLVFKKEFRVGAFYNQRIEGKINIAMRVFVLVTSRNSSLFYAGIIGPVVALVLVFSDVAISPWFSWGSNALSDLGVHSYYYLFDGGLIIEAIFNVVFVVGLFGRFKDTRIPSTLLIISGASLGLVGVFNENHHPYHTLFAMIYFLLFPISIIAFSVKTRAFSKSLSFFGVSIAIASLIAIFFGIGMVFDFLNLSGVGLAIPEMFEALLLSVWMIIAATFILISEKYQSTKKISDVQQNTPEH